MTSTEISLIVSGLGNAFLFFMNWAAKQKEAKRNDLNDDVEALQVAEKMMSKVAELMQVQAELRAQNNDNEIIINNMSNNIDQRDQLITQLQKENLQHKSDKAMLQERINNLQEKEADLLLEIDRLKLDYETLKKKNHSGG